MGDRKRNLLMRMWSGLNRLELLCCGYGCYITGFLALTRWISTITQVILCIKGDALLYCSLPSFAQYEGVSRSCYKTTIQLHLVAESQPYHLQFSLRVASPETFGYTLVYLRTSRPYWGTFLKAWHIDNISSIVIIVTQSYNQQVYAINRTRSVT
jgi:hypothetical protein